MTFLRSRAYGSLIETLSDLSSRCTESWRQQTYTHNEQDACLCITCASTKPVECPICRQTALWKLSWSRVQVIPSGLLALIDIVQANYVDENADDFTCRDRRGPVQPVGEVQQFFRAGDIDASQISPWQDYLHGSVDENADDFTCRIVSTSHGTKSLSSAVPASVPLCPTSLA